jgi:hypothetical protein
MSVRILTLIVACAVALPAQAQTGASSSERLTLSREKAGQVARRDLLSLLQPGGEFMAGKKIIADEGYLYTRPVATEFAGLCRRDQLIVSYAAIPRPGVEPRNQPLEPYSVRADTQYRVIADRVKFTTDDEDREDLPALGRFEGDCPRFDGKGNDGWFSSSDTYTAGSGFNALASAVVRLRDGSLVAKCDSEVYAKGSCRDEIFSVARGENLWSIGKCEAVWPRSCYSISSYGVSIEVRVNNPRLTRPEDVESIEVTGQIFV